MAASRKLRTAHFLMFMGVMPLLLAVAVTIAAILTARAHPGQAGLSDGFILFALLGLGFVTTLVLGCSGALWSWYLTERGIDTSTTATLVLRSMVGAGLVLPVLWYAQLYFSFLNRG